MTPPSIDGGLNQPAAVEHTGEPQAPKATTAETVSTEEYNGIWHQLWDAGLQPGMYFDASAPSPALVNLLASGALGDVTGKRFFVPGCGRGYDVNLAARAGGVAVGLDLSPSAIRDAEKHRDETEAQEVAQHARFVAGDFFTYEDPSGLFDYGYDYTFLCALHPTMREGWAAAWARHLAPGGELITLVYPVDPSKDANQGPPWPVTPELYKSLLLPAGFECVYLEPIPSELSHSSRAGREWLGRWRMVGPAPQ